MTINKAVEPVCWGMPHVDGSIYDVICNDEHARHEGQYTVPLYTSPPPDHTAAIRLALEALTTVPALIKYQFTGSREAMSALQNASNDCDAAIAALEGSLK